MIWCCEDVVTDECRGTGRAEECIYCLRKSLAMEPQDVLALWEISAQYKATGKMARVRLAVM